MATITPVGGGVLATGNNTSVVPTVHASTVAGDLVLALASIRNSGTGTVNTPTGWTTVLNFGNMRLMGRIWQAGDVAPTITFAGGVANADTLGQTATWRGVSAEVLLTAPATNVTVLNGSAQDIGYSALAIPRDRHLVVLAAWKQNIITTTTTPATFTALGVASSAAGDDAAQAWFSVIQTTAANIASGTLTITGGAAAISRAMAVALKPAPSIAVATQAVYPPRVLVSVTDLTIGDAIQIYRSVSGVRTLVRAASSAAVTDPSFLRRDAELPFGVPVTYIAVVNGVEYSTGATTYTLTGGKVALSDAITGTSAEVVISAWPEKLRDRRTSWFRVGGRNVVVAGDFTAASGSIELYLDAISSLQNVYNLLAQATEGIVQLRQSGPYAEVDCYVVVEAVRERRYSQDGSDPKRFLTLDVIGVEGWAPTLEAAGYTYAALETAYTGLTYAQLATDYATYLALAQASF